MPIDPNSVTWDSPKPDGIVWDDAPKKKGIVQENFDNLRDLVAGGVRGAGSIVATLLWPIDKAQDLYYGDRGASTKAPSRNEERRKSIDEGLTELVGSNPNSLAYKGGKLVTEVAGTAGAGGAIANGLRYVAPALSNTPQAVNVLRAIETAGAQGGGLGTRTLGGAVNGGLSAGMVNPEDAWKGAAIGGSAPAAIALAGKAGSYLGNAFRGKAADPQRLTAAQTANNAGYVIPPSDIRQQGALIEAMGGFSGKIKTAQEASARNQAVTTNLAKKDLGLDESAPITREALQAVRARAGEAYNTIRNAGEVTADDTFNAAINAIGDQMRGASRSFPGLKKDEVSGLVEALKQPKFDSGDAVDAIRVLRDQADGLFARGNKGEAKAYSAASKALEDALERHLAKNGSPEALAAFQEARRTIAKTYTVEKALNSQTGEVSAQVLAQQLKRGKPLTGGLKTAAQAGEAFPKATQALKESPKAVSPLDWAMATMTGTATGNPLALAMPAARPLTRNLLLSPMMQRRALQPPSEPLLNLLGSDQNQQLLYRSLPALAADR